MLAHIAEHEVGALRGEGQQFLKKAAEGADRRLSAGGVQEKPAQRGFHHDKLHDITQAYLFAVMTDQQRKGKNHRQRQQEMKN